MLLLDVIEGDKMSLVLVVMSLALLNLLDEWDFRLSASSVRLFDMVSGKELFNDCSDSQLKFWWNFEHARSQWRIAAEFANWSPDTH